MPKSAWQGGGRALVSAITHSAAVTNPMAALKPSLAPLTSSRMIIRGSMGDAMGGTEQPCQPQGLSHSQCKA